MRFITSVIKLLASTTAGKVVLAVLVSTVIAGASAGYLTIRQSADKQPVAQNKPVQAGQSIEPLGSGEEQVDEKSEGDDSDKKTEKKSEDTKKPKSSGSSKPSDGSGSGGGDSGGDTGGGSQSCPSGQVGTPPSCYPSPPAPAASGKNWRLAWGDEFNGSSLNTNKWTPCFDWNYGSCTRSFNGGREAYQPSQVQLSGGTAKLVAEPMSPTINSSGCYQDTCNYKSGLISTARPRANNGSDYLYTFTYGYIEARMKVPSTSGMFTAFWMLPSNHDPYTYEEEIDILELLGGNPDTAFMTYHYNNRGDSHHVNQGNNNNGSCAVRDFSTGFVRYGLDWQPGHVAWYIDGVKCGQYTGTSSDATMQIIINVMVDNSWERDWGLTLPNLSASDQLEIDYVRVYQQH